MNPPEFPAGETKKELQLQGPRPTPLKVSKESHKIRKPPLPLPPAHHHSTAEASQQRQPVIIYSVSPKAITVSASDFMDVVQRLTGSSSGDKTPAGAGDVSPAARLASIEKTSPTEKERIHSGDDMMCMPEGVDVSQFPSILSPAPATLPPISSEFFSPVTDHETLSFLHELSPFWSANSFMASPSGLLSAAVLSPLPSPEIFSLFD